MVVSVCEFLTDVVFQDFPAEVFLQRPSIVKVGAAAVVVTYKKQEAFEKCWAHSALRAASRQFTRCR